MSKSQSRIPGLSANASFFFLAAPLLVFSIHAQPSRAALPPIPKGVSVINADDDNALRTGILSKTDVAMISLQEAWGAIQSDANGEATYDWMHLDSSLSMVAGSGKSALLRMPSMGGAEGLGNGGNTPDWVFTDMGVEWTSTNATPGVTYSFVDGTGVTRCIPVFWNPVYLAKKKRLIAMAGAHAATNPALEVFVVSFANDVSEDWNVPDAANSVDGGPSQVELWLNTPTENPPGAGYTTQLMIDDAIHQGNATFSDGIFSGTSLTSASANFTQADMGHVISSGALSVNSATIQSWLSPTEVTLSRAMPAAASQRFTIVARRDGLFDVAMAAFPNQYIAMAVGGDGGQLDLAAAGSNDPNTYLAITVDNLVEVAYPSRYITQRNSVSTEIPAEADSDGTAWAILAQAAEGGYFTAGQALGVCYDNTTYRMNGGDDCDHDNAVCMPPCDPGTTCGLTDSQILERSADLLITYSAANGTNLPNYYEIYQPDALNLDDAVMYIDAELNGPSPIHFFGEFGEGPAGDGSRDR